MQEKERSYTAWCQLARRQIPHPGWEVLDDLVDQCSVLKGTLLAGQHRQHAPTLLGRHLLDQCAMVRALTLHLHRRTLCFHFRLFHADAA